jgi:hypothetical protein
MDSLICEEHHLTACNFCPQCTQFLCNNCECPHFPNQKLIPSWFIKRYLLHLKGQQYNPTTEQINKGKSQLIDSYNEEAARLKTSFHQALQFLDTFANKKTEFEDIKKNLIEIGVTDKSFALFNSFLDDNQTKCFDYVKTQTFQSYVDSGLNMIKSIAAISEQLATLKSSISEQTYCIKDVPYWWKKNKFSIYSVEKKQAIEFKLNASINDFAESIVCKNKLYVIGGFDKGPIGYTFEVDINNSSMTPKNQMPVKKYCHSLCTFNDMIYAVGGYNTIALNDCKKYNVLANRWTPMPSLNTARYWCATFILNNFVYAFGGYKFEYLNSMEKIAIREDLKKWDIMNVSNACSPRHSIGAAVIRDKEVLLFGGYERKGLSDESYILKISENSIECCINAKMERGSQFIFCPASVCDGANLYGISFERSIHVYSLEASKWSIL